jgi:hypothetical protein
VRQEAKNVSDKKETFASIREKQGLRDYLAFEAVWHTRTFKQFCQKNRDRVTGELSTRLREISRKPRQERSELEQAWQELPFGEVLNETLRSEFLKTYKGKQVLSRLEVFEWRERAISYSSKEKNLLMGKLLELRINLTFPKERIRAEFEHMLNEMHPKVERPPTPTRGGGVMKPGDIERMYQAYGLVEARLAQGENISQSVLQATLQIYTKARQPRLKKPSVEDPRYQQVLRWHQKVKDIIGDL